MSSFAATQAPTSELKFAQVTVMYTPEGLFQASSGTDFMELILGWDVEQVSVAVHVQN